MDNEKLIKQSNRKAMPKFILVVVIGCIVGGTFGYFSERYGLDTLSGTIKIAGDFFGTNIAPWLLAAMAIILPIISIPIYNNAKNMLKSWDGEDEDVSDTAERKISKVIWITGTAVIVSFFLIAATYSGGFAIVYSEINITALFVGIVSFLVIMIEALIIQQKSVDAAKKTNPEKTASVYDLRFQKKWMDSCDEAEKIMIGKCAYKAYISTNTVCTILTIILVMGALVFDIGFLPSLVVCVIWIVNQSVYSKEAMKISKPGSIIR